MENLTKEHLQIVVQTLIDTYQFMNGDLKKELQFDFQVTDKQIKFKWVEKVKEHTFEDSEPETQPFYDSTEINIYHVTTQKTIKQIASEVFDVLSDVAYLEIQTIK